jgi:hypothetical protein
MRFFGGLTVDEIAGMADVSEGELRRILDETGIGEFKEPADVLLPEG